MKYMVSSQEKIHNYPLYYVHTDLDSFILFNDVEIEVLFGNNIDTLENIVQLEQLDPPPKLFWNMSFYEGYSKESYGAGV